MSDPQVFDIEMPTGHYLDISDPPHADIRLDDIAHRLAQTNRFGGATFYPYPVAQHAVLVSRRMEALRLPPEACFEGLHHDDGEFIATDIQKPVKMYFEHLVGERNPISILEDAWQAEINTRFGIADEWHTEVKSADVWAVLIEARNLLPSRGRAWRSRPAIEQWRLETGNTLPERLRTPSYWRGEIHWTAARDEYLERHHELLEAMSR